MFDHLEFSVSDIIASRRFYKTICDAIGVQEVFFNERERSVGFGDDTVVRFMLTEGQATTPFLHVCFAAQSRDAVERAHAGAINSGGVDNGMPGYRDYYSLGYYAAFVRDPDGHNIEILYREARKSGGRSLRHSDPHRSPAVAQGRLAMFDVQFRLANQTAALAELGEAMGATDHSFEGGGVFTVDGGVHAHFLFRDGDAAALAARRVGIDVVAVTPVLVRKLHQDIPGQLGAIARALADSGVKILTQYSDHHNQLILITDDQEKAALATKTWAPGN